MECKFYDWAKGKTKTETIQRARKAEYDVVNQILIEMETDTENESMKLLSDYAKANESERAIMDSFLVRLCGFTMESIIAKAKENENIMY